MFEIARFAATVTIPCFIIVFLGWLLKRRQVIDDAFITTGSKIIFNIALPTLIFLSITQNNITEIIDVPQVTFGLAATFVGFLAIWIISGRVGVSAYNRGVFVQASFRGNMGIIGLALCQNMYGTEGLAIGAILLAFLTLLYNVLSIVSLTLAAHQDRSEGTHALNLSRVFTDIVKNPLIISIVLALMVSYLHLNIPPVLKQSAAYFANMTLPLALLCVGGSISLQALRSSSALSAWALALKLMILPFSFTLAGFVLGLQGVLLGTLFLMFASPTATVSFVMVKAIGGNAELAANIVALSTICSVLTISLGIFAGLLFGVF
ncbi:MAG: AEC family transporter [Hahellaceae bacterium]|jgi:hypothetical protein|nr:AEC family transporter [Hahellaceae bacterium]MCP5209887.1 AEC family transporter [Hahellaceae bacterium]